VDLEDKLMWTPSHSGQLCFKEAYLFKTRVGHHLSWAKVIWSSDIPPFKSMLAWRLMQDIIPMMTNLSIEASSWLPCAVFAQLLMSHLFIFSFSILLLRKYGLGLLAS